MEVRGNQSKDRLGTNAKSDFDEGLILAQDERWRRALRMQVERPGSPGSGRRLSNAQGTCPTVGDNPPKGGLIPHSIPRGSTAGGKPSGAGGGACVPSSRWEG